MNNYVIDKCIVVNQNIQIQLLNVSNNTNNLNCKIIPTAQLNEINSYKRKFDQDKRLLVRSFLYEFLKATHGITNFELTYNSFQKPFLKFASTINFSISYANDYVGLAICDGKKIGFDMEWTKSLKLSELEEIAPMIMSESESRKFMATTGAERINLFFEQFSSKESIIKAFGTGLHYDVRTIDTTAEGTVYCFDSLNFEQKYLGPFRDEYVMSICYQT